MLRQFFTAMALTAAIAAGTGISMPAAQTDANSLASHADSTMLNGAFPQVLAQTSAEATGFVKRP